MSTEGHGEQNSPLPKHAEANRPSEKIDSGETGNRVRSELSNKDRETLNDRSKEDRDPANRLSRHTAGRGSFGECAIADIKLCGANKDTAVQLKNGLPEKIETGSQLWERSAKNPQVWHVQSGDQRFDLKADVRMQGNDVAAKIKYENGREITFKNGEPSQINHPNGEKWTADPKHPGKWDVSAPNHEDPDHPKIFSIQDVKVNPRDGDITWHVDKGAGKGHDREIDAHNQYHDHKGGEKQAVVPPIAEQPAQPRKPQEFVMRLGKPADSKHVDPILQAPMRAEVPPPIPKPVEIQAKHFDAPSPILQAPMKAEVPPPIPKPVEIQAKHFDAPSPILQAPLKAELPPPIPKPVEIQAKHFDAPSPVLQAPLKADVPPPIPQPIRQAEAPRPEPPRPIEQSPFVPAPHPQKLQEVAAPHPLPLPKEHISDSQQQVQKQILENSLKEMQERAAKAQVEAAHMLPNISVSSLKIPQLPESAKAHQPYALPVPRPRVLSTHAEPVLVQPMAEKNYVQPLPAPVPFEPQVEKAAPHPIMPKAETYVTAPAPVPIETHSTPSVPQLAEVRPKHVANDVPPPVLPSKQYKGPVIEMPTPSVPKPEPVRQADHEEKTRLQGVVNYDSKPAVVQQQPAAAPEQQQHKAPQSHFEFTASVNAPREHSVYDDGPKTVEDSTQKIQLHAGASDRNHARLNAQAGSDQHASYLDGSGMVQLANVSHRVPISVTGVVANQGHYEATLNNPALGRNGQPLPNQVSWVGGRIEGTQFVIEQARINNGPVFSTLGVLPLRQRR